MLVKTEIVGVAIVERETTVLAGRVETRVLVSEIVDTTVVGNGLLVIVRVEMET